jgi:hypothetical protein
VAFTWLMVFLRSEWNKLMIHASWNAKAVGECKALCRSWNNVLRCESRGEIDSIGRNG